MRLVKIEYTSDVEAHSAHTTLNGDPVEPTVVAKGTVRRVDAASAKSLVENRKVAKYVDAEAKAAVKAETAKSEGGKSEGGK